MGNDKVTRVEIVYTAKCRHCKHLLRVKVGKLVRHLCNNPASDYYKMRNTLEDKACKEFEL